jgi:Tol biopolymer transport system component
VLAPACLAGGGVAEATFPGGDGLVAYVAGADCDDQGAGGCPDAVVEVADLRRPGPRHVVGGRGPCLPDRPAWSPDGKALLFDCVGRVFLTRRDGSPDKLVAENAAEPAWSAEGHRLVFSRYVPEGDSDLRSRELFVRRLRGGRPRRLTRGARADWSSRGEIAFVRYDRRYRSDVFLVRPSGEGLRRLSRGGVSGEPSWSPDGRLLAIERRTGRRTNVVVIDRRGRVRRTLTRKGGFKPVWSPDGSRIAFSRANFSRTFTIRARGGELRRVLRDVRLSNGQLAWQPRPGRR